VLAMKQGVIPQHLHFENPSTLVEWETLPVRVTTQPEDWRIALDLMRTGRVSVEHMLTGTNFVPLEGIQGAFEALCHPTSELQMVVEL